MGNEVGSIKIGDGRVTINIGDISFETLVPGINDLGINPNKKKFHNYGDAHVLGPTWHFNGPGMLYEDLTEQPTPFYLGVKNFRYPCCSCTAHMKLLCD